MWKSKCLFFCMCVCWDTDCPVLPACPCVRCITPCIWIDACWSAAYLYRGDHVPRWVSNSANVGVFGVFMSTVNGGVRETGEGESVYFGWEEFHVRVANRFFLNRPWFHNLNASRCKFTFMRRVEGWVLKSASDTQEYSHWVVESWCRIYRVPEPPLGEQWWTYGGPRAARWAYGGIDWALKWMQWWGMWCYHYLSEGWV